MKLVAVLVKTLSDLFALHIQDCLLHVRTSWQSDSNMCMHTSKIIEFSKGIHMYRLKCI